MKLPTDVDIRCENHGSLVLVRAMTEEGSAWIAEHVDPEAVWWAGALVVEPRCLVPLLQGMEFDGLRTPLRAVAH
jgi:hypothetical protein